MFNLSLTACSFCLRKTNSRGNTKVYNLNSSFTIKQENGIDISCSDFSDLFGMFFEEHHILVKDDNKQQSFRCEYDKNNCVETDDFKMIYARVYSGMYGSSSDIIDGKTQQVKYKKKSSDIDIRPFYLMVVFPKDSAQITVQKGLFIFQNLGPFGVKTITTKQMREYFSERFRITLKCNTIAPELFIKKVIRQDNIKKLVMIKNVKSSDVSDNISKGYGTEIREIANLRFDESAWSKLLDKIRFVSGGRYNLFEFEQNEYDNLKVVVEIGGRTRKINLHNLDNLSIIEGIPDEIKRPDGHPDLSRLLEYFTKVSSEYLEEMVLQIN